MVELASCSPASATSSAPLSKSSSWFFIVLPPSGWLNFLDASGYLTTIPNNIATQIKNQRGVQEFFGTGNSYLPCGRSDPAVPLLVTLGTSFDQTADLEYRCFVRSNISTKLA